MGLFGVAIGTIRSLTLVYLTLACVFICANYIAFFSFLGEGVKNINYPFVPPSSASNKFQRFKKFEAPPAIYILPSARKPGKIINFPPLLGLNVNSWKEVVPNQDMTRMEKLKLLTNAFQVHLDYFQKHAPCTNYTLKCGHDGSCGLGCQLHHRATCVILSYTMGIPLIHDAPWAWPSDTPWEAVYKRLGSSCEENENTIYFYFTSFSPILHFDKDCSIRTFDSCPFHKQFEYPLKNGIPIPKELYEILKANHDDPFLWYVGQFMKYAIRQSPQMEETIKEAAAAVGFHESVHVVGAHIRRTDKTTEASDSHHEVMEYMKWAEVFFRSTYSTDFEPRVVYIASDEHTVLGDVQKLYAGPLWKVIGVKSNQTFETQEDRRSEEALQTIVQDIHFLSSCEHVICGLSSNVCRLVLELLATKYPDIWKRLKSLDGRYAYILLEGTPPKRLIPL